MYALVHRIVGEHLVLNEMEKCQANMRHCPILPRHQCLHATNKVRLYSIHLHLNEYEQ